MAFPLTRRDALAWESLPSELRGWRHTVFLLWLGGGGLIVAALPERLVGPENGLRFYTVLILAIAFQYALAALWMTLWRHLRARRRCPAPTLARLTVWQDRLSETREDQPGAAPLVVTPELVRQVVVTPAHLFIEAASGVLIVPATAFADSRAMGDFAAHWDMLSQAAED